MASPRAEVVGDGVPFAEGPVWCADGTLVATSVAEGALYRVDPVAGRAHRFARTGGGANGAALAADGSILVTQNGGFDFGATGLFPDPPPFEPVTPGLQHATPDGRVVYLTGTGATAAGATAANAPGASAHGAGLQAPNDLVVTPDGDVLFTDPPHYPPPADGLGRVMRYARDGTLAPYATGFWYCNGIALDRDGHVVVVERQGLQRVFPDGNREWIVEVLGRGAGDGFCVDADGRFYIASTVEHGIRVVDHDGAILDFLPIDGDGLTTNCCFGGPDLRTLFCTDALPGRVVAFEHMPTPGRPLVPWPGPELREQLA